MLVLIIFVCTLVDATKVIIDRREEQVVTNGSHGKGTMDYSGAMFPQEDSLTDDTRWEQVRSRNRTVFNCVVSCKRLKHLHPVHCFCTNI